MGINYLKMFLHSLLRNRLFSFINMSGLAVGLASAMLIGLYVAHELSYDRYHPAAERIYRLGRDFYPREGFAGLHLATLPAVAAAQLRADYPEMEIVARAHPNAGLLARGDRLFYEDGMLFADPGLLEIFSFIWLAGDPSTALDLPSSIVLTESLAHKYFGDESPLGQTLLYENRIETIVTGVIRDLPDNTHLRATALQSMDVLLDLAPVTARDDWGANVMHTYVRIAANADIDSLRAAFADFINRHVPPRAGFTLASQSTGITAMNIRDIHLHSTRQNEMGDQGNGVTVSSLAIVAGGILLIACFNFMNLSTACSAPRGLEVAVRKAIGAQRRQLIVRFLGEALGMVLCAMLLGIMLVELALPAFSAFVGRALDFDLWGNLRLQTMLALLALVVGGTAGCYPALYLSAFRPAQVLRSRSAPGIKEGAFRNLLVVLQFSLSIALVVATAVVALQMRYVRDFDAGFSGKQIVVLNGSPSQGLTDRWELLRGELLRLPNVTGVTASNMVPGRENLVGTRLRAQGAAESDAAEFSTLIVDYDFFETYQVQLRAGRLFSRDFAGDRLPLEPGQEMQGNFILNASAARAFGWSPEQAVGQVMQTGLDGAGATHIRGRIVGVVADSNFESLHHEVKPLLFMLGQQGARATFSSASVRVTGKDMAATLAAIDSTWKNIIPEFPVSRHFLSDNLEAMYHDDTRLGQIVSSFAALTILIACLGLFGLATYIAQRRTKEIGVRKVMGGSVWSIVLLLTNDFSRLVLISNLVAWPVAYFAMERWLENFAYRIDLTPLVFIGSGLIALCIAWVTVGGTAAKAASQKPVLALRYE